MLSPRKSAYRGTEQSLLDLYIRICHVLRGDVTILDLTGQGVYNWQGLD